jgi:zinc protease
MTASGSRVHPYPEYGPPRRARDASKLPTARRADRGQVPRARTRTTLRTASRSCSPGGTRFPGGARPAGSTPASRPTSSPPGTASLADRACSTRARHPLNALQISDTLAELGATLGTASQLDVSSVSMQRSQDSSIPRSICTPTSSCTRVPAGRLSQRRSGSGSPDPAREGRSGGDGAAVFPQAAVTAEGHAYANPGRARHRGSVAQMTARRLSRFHRPGSSRTTPRSIVRAHDAGRDPPKLERLFGRWKPGDVPHKNIGTVASARAVSTSSTGRDRGVDDPSPRHLAAPKANPDEPPTKP